MIYSAEIKNNNALIRHCYGYGSEIEIPDTLDGCPVTELLAYAFSDHRDRRRRSQASDAGRLMLWDDDLGAELDESELMQDIPAAEGRSITSVSLPAALKKIGAYAFYNCTRLSSISFHEGLGDLGAGLFSCCRSLRELTVHTGESGRTCLREMLQELRQELTVYVDGSISAKLVFPAYYEEVVENTPARVFSTEMHGSGRSYRDCFSGRVLDLHAYDSCFARAGYAEEADTLTGIALGRLTFPESLTEESRLRYENWLYEHFESAVSGVISARDIRSLSFLAGNKRTTAAELDMAARRAADAGFAEGTALIMDALGSRRREAGRKLQSSKRFAL